MSLVDRIELSGLTFTAVVGVLPEERTRPQPLRVQLALEVDLTAAGHSDHLADTVDYGRTCDVVVETARAGEPVLLERMAHEICTAVLHSDDRITAVELALVKLRPPVPHDLASAGVRIRRRRGASDGA